MILGPYTSSTLAGGFVRYGNWTGNGYSANVLSPDFVALTAAQKAVPGFDPFDAVSAVHDQAYDTAQQNLLLDLANGASGSKAMVSYLTTLQQADHDFVAAASLVRAATPWGQTVQQVSLEAISVKADWESADIQRIQSDPVYAARLDALATPATTQQALLDIHGFDAANATPESVAAYKSQLYSDSPFLARTQDVNVAVSGSLQKPALIPEILSSGSAISLYLGSSVVGGVEGATLLVDNGTVILTGNSGSLAIHGLHDMMFSPGVPPPVSQLTEGLPTLESLVVSATKAPALIREIASTIGSGIAHIEPLPASGFAGILHAAPGVTFPPLRLADSHHLFS